MFSPHYPKALDFCAAVHMKSREKFVSEKINNKEKAIYLLQGSAITQGYLSITSWENGDLNSILFSKRFIDECFNAGLFFSVVEDEDRRLTRWLEGEYLTIPDLDNSKNSGIRLAIEKKIGLTPETSKDFFRLVRDLGTEVSRSAHPTLGSVRYNLDKRNWVFNYRSDKLAFHIMPNFDFGSMIVIPVIDNLLHQRDVLSLSDVDYISLCSIRNQVEKISYGMRGKTI